MQFNPLSTQKLTMLSGTIITSLMLTACGGGGGDDTTPSKQNQMITFPTLTAMAIGESADLTATTSSKLAITYQSNSKDICVVSDNKVTAKAIGDCKITASQAGNNTFSPAKDVTISFPVISDMLIVEAKNLTAHQSGVITLKGKKVVDGLTATLAEKPIVLKKPANYMTEITLSANDLAIAGDVPLMIKQGDKILYHDVIKVALPKATGNPQMVKKTGVTTCGNNDSNDIACDDKAKLGEFYQLNQDGDVKIGAEMSYTKVAYQTNTNGKKSMDYCVYDNVTGLTWEQKTDDGLRGKNWKYSWYDSNAKTNGGFAGADAPIQDTCNKTLAKCNSESYIKKLNEMKYCGYSDWRLPTEFELLGVRDFGKKQEPFVNDIFNVAKVIRKDMEDYQNSSFYLTKSSLYVSPETKKLGTQMMMVVSLSDNFLIYTGTWKNKEEAHSILAVR